MLSTIRNMEHLNLTLFAHINAGANLHGYKLWLGIFAAKYLIFLIVIFLMGVWLWGSKKQRSTLLIAFIAVIISLLMNWGISHIWFHPRPFMLGVGYTYLIHGPDSSFPSDHVTVLFTISLVFLLQTGMRLPAFFILFLTILVAWARIYVGVHFPFDMLGAVFVSAFSVSILARQSCLIEHYLLPMVEYCHQKLFSRAIAWRWSNK
jgi:undecaprenyl-diphosphatase